MKAIYKRELKSYFSSVIGCLFIAATVLVSGVFFVLYNLLSGYSTMEPPLFYAALGLALFVPILTMKVMAEERRQKTDQLFLTAPVSLAKVVIGKYLALLTIFAIPVAVICTYPLIMSLFGAVQFKLCYFAISGFVLYGAALIAIGVFISSITELQVVAAIISIAVMFLGFFMGSITGMISQEGNILTKVLSAFDTMSPLNNIIGGSVSLSNVIYYLSIIALFLFLTCQAVQKRRWSISAKRIGTGVFSFGLIAIVVVVVIFVNLIAQVVTDNVSACTVDTTKQGIYSISKKTEDMIKKLDKDINIYVLSPKATSDQLVNKTLDRYAAASKHIKLEYKDTNKNPNFYKQYANTAPSANSIIVENPKNKKSKVIDYNNIFIQDQMAQYYGQSGGVTAYDAEGQIDSAIAYVQSDQKFTVYQVEGHKEACDDQNNFGTMNNLTEVITKHNCEIKKVNLAAKKEISTDECAMILLLGPKKDYTKSDAKKIIDYLEIGGKAIVGFENGETVDTDKPNFNSILEKYNVKVQNGSVAENDTNNYAAQGGPFYTFAKGQDLYAEGTSGYVFAPFSIGLNKNNKNNEDIVYTALATTSKSAVLKVNPTNAKTPTKESGDVSGPFDLAISLSKNVAATKASTNTETAETLKADILAFASVYSLSDNFDELSSGANTEIVNNAMNDYIDTDIETVAISQKSLQAPALTVSMNSAIIVGAIIVIIIPLAFLVFGIVIWAVRRKR